MSTLRSEGPPPETRHGRGAGRASIVNSDFPDFARLYVEHADEWISWIDAQGRLLFVNPAICRALGYSAAQLYSLRVWDVSPTTPESWLQFWSEIKHGHPRTGVAELRSRSGGVVPAQFEIKLVDSNGAEYLLFRARDLREHPAPPDHSPELLPLEPSANAIFILNKGRVVDSNRKEEQLFGCPREQIVEELESSLRESGHLKSVFNGDDFAFVWQSRRPDASSFTIECTVSRIEIEGAVRLVASVVDVTSRRRSERTLAQLSGRLLQLQDEERRRIARELHDTTGQNLGALSINLSMILATCELDRHARETLDECIALTDSSVREIRTLSYLLHPPLLDELGLASALRAYSEGYAERTGLVVELDLPSGMLRLPQAIEIALFRIVQEGLTNIHRHSGSSTAILRLKYQLKGVELEVSDRGRGLPPGILEGEMTSASRIGVGIAGMRERARQLGGRLTIGWSETGTTLHVVLPLTQKSGQSG